MSGLGNFGLSSLGSMSTLGSLAQSAQRLDRLMAGNRSRQQESTSFGRNNSRRAMDNNFFGGRSSDRNRRRSPSPPRRFNRDDRNGAHRDRGRRSRDDNIYGSASGAGILGAAPGGNDRSSGNSGLGDLGGSTWSDSNAGGGGINLNSQTQQLINMMQTQQLLAAVQAQAKLANQGPPPSLMGNSVYSRQGGGRMMNTRGGRFNRNDMSRPGGYSRRDYTDRKRRRSPPPRPFKRERRDDSIRKDGKKGTSADKDSSKKDAKSQGKETAKAKAKGTESNDQKPMEESKIAKNAAGEVIEDLVKNNYDGKRYWCSLCKIVCMKSKNIYKHFLSERHVKAAVEKEGKVFDPEIMKQQEVKKVEEKPKDISELLKYTCSTKQTARKEKNDIYISSLTDCTVKITNFTTEQDFMGSEFVKAVSGFKCQLCKIFMRHGHQIIQHLKGKKHKANYEKYLKENPDYLKNQRDVNKNLVEMLKKNEGTDVVLQESKADGHKADEKDMEVELDMDDFEQSDTSKVDDDSKMADESTFDDSAIDNSITDYSLLDSEKESSGNKAENSEGQPESKEVQGEKSVDTGNEVEGKNAEKDFEDEVEAGNAEEIDAKEDEDVEEAAEEKEKELSIEAEEEEEEFPLLSPPTNPINDDEAIELEETEEKPEMEAVPEVEVKVPEVEPLKEPEIPETPVEVGEPDEVEEVTPTRRGRKAKRGRGGAKAARGRRRTPRGAKNVKKTEEVAEPEEEVAEAPLEIEKEPEKEPEQKVAVVEVPDDAEEELPVSQDIDEVMQSQETVDNVEVEGIDGFEVIDEVEGASDEESEQDD